jgi:hypothetical protein
MFLGLIQDISPNYICSHFVPYTSDKLGNTPKLTSRKIPSQYAKLFKHFPLRYTLQYLHHFRWRVFWRNPKRYVHRGLHYLHGIYPEHISLCYPLKHFFCVSSILTFQDVFSILRYPNQMVPDIKYSMLFPSCTHAAVIQEKPLARQALLPRLPASRFPPPASWRVSRGVFYEMAPI